MKKPDGCAGMGNPVNQDTSTVRTNIVQTGVTAKAFKALALLYAASPLNNQLGIKDWEEAAKAGWDAIKTAELYGYALLSAAEYKKNYAGADYTNESFWSWPVGDVRYNHQYPMSIVPWPISGPSGGTANGECPTQNCVDRFETRWGDPLNTQAERDAATALGHYNEQDPYVNRDPRLTIDIIYNQAPGMTGYLDGKAQMWTNSSTSYGELVDPTRGGYTKTGYYNRKRWGGGSIKNQVVVRWSDPNIRFGELYLDYAEAANEAYGPNSAAPGASMSAVDAINFVRTRIGQSPVLPAYTGSTDAFRPRIKNERVVELCFEHNHYFCDIRRWKDAPVAMAGPLIGVKIEKLTAPTAQYPTGFKYTRYPLEAARQSVWKPAMYYIPFDPNLMFKFKDFAPNTQWD